ncbi:hypothetical protein pb186bvf_016061 [Paramecium bursaria]
MQFLIMIKFEQNPCFVDDEFKNSSKLFRKIKIQGKNTKSKLLMVTYNTLRIRYNHLDLAKILNKPSLIQFYIEQSPHLHKVQQYYPRYINIQSEIVLQCISLNILEIIINTQSNNNFSKLFQMIQFDYLLAQLIGRNLKLFIFMTELQFKGISIEQSQRLYYPLKIFQLFYIYVLK